MKHIIVTLFCLVLMQITGISAQDNFIPGQIISLDSVIIDGLIDYQNWRVNPKSVRFRPTASSETVEYKADKILGFKAGDEEYLGQIVNIDQNSFDYSRLRYSKIPEISKDTVFLQTLFSGEKSLYFLFKGNGRPYFFISLNGEITLLEYHMYLKLKNNQSFKAESKRYIGQLNYYFRDAKEFQAIISQLDYVRADMERLFSEYYDSRTKDLEFRKEREKTRVAIKPIIGISNSNIDFSGQLSQRISSIDNMPSTHPLFGIGFDLIIARNNGKWSFNNELIYTTHSASGYNSNQTIYGEVSFSHLKLHTMARYRYLFENGSLFSNIGFSNGIIVSETNYSKEESIFTSSEGVVFPKIRNYELGILFGFGVDYDKWSLEARYERGNGVSAFINISSTATRYSLLLGYRL